MLRSVAVAVCLAFITQAQAAVPGYGKRSQVGQLVRAIESRNKPAPKATFVRRQPFLQKVAAFLRPGLSTKDDAQRIDRFIEEAEQRFGAPISKLDHPALVDGRRMRAEKTLALLQFNRRPEEVTEGFLHTQARVEGIALATRDIFVQRWRPVGKPSGKVFVIAPGFLETGRNYYEQIQLLNQQGHDVVVLDQQWAGYTADAQKGVIKGGIDRGFGISRDVADVAAYGNELLEREYGQHPGKQLVLVGTSMGGGPGVLGALKLYDEGKLTLGAGRSIPKDRGWIVQAPFLGRTKTLINNVLDVMGRIPGVRQVPLPAIGVPLLNDDPSTNVKIAAHAVSEDVRGRPQAFRAAVRDIGWIRSLIAQTGAPAGRGYVIQARADHLADTKTVLETVDHMQGAPVKLDLLPGKNHVVEETPGQQRHILLGADYVKN